MLNLCQFNNEGSHSKVFNLEIGLDMCQRIDAMAKPQWKPATYLSVNISQKMGFVGFMQTVSMLRQLVQVDNHGLLTKQHCKYV